MCDISIGDLVCLKGDKTRLMHGIGLILDKREDTADILREFIEELGVPSDNEMKEQLDVANNYLLNNSVFLVHWQGGRKVDVFRNIWMFYSEIELLSKVNNNTENSNG